MGNSTEIQQIVLFQKYMGLQPLKHENNDSNASKYKTKYPLIHFCFRLASKCGEEIYSLIPLLFWICPRLASSFTLNFCVILCLTQYLKDIFMIPRPVSSSIVILENHFDTEYGFPSSHAG